MDTFRPPAQFLLSRPADPETIVVRVNGVEVPADHWEFAAGSNSVVFADDHHPPAGSAIEICYVVLCLDRP